ncbi:uncharacterized protein LOC120426234 [Culex pipiens pallens]|uniref:uncharacterized protein LOC120426234 n=1 Tax=Culex pipiens pallens TaxID=42434 RepID=UPI0019547EC0|nr:uncharacterized protein LOC120426234 [Culex pipiens pallens]
MTSDGMTVRVKTILVIAMVLCCFDFVKGGCLSYGHSCWGAHGKRSGPPLARRPLPRTIPAGPIGPPDGWSALERMKPPEAGSFVAGSKAYYPPLGRLFQFPPAAVLDLLGSSENDIDSTEPEDTDYGGPQPNRNVMSLGDRFQRLQREQRRKAALYETASSGTDTSSSGNSSSGNADDANDIGQALVDEAKNSEDMTEKDVNFGRLLNGNHRHRKYDRA